MVVNEIKQPHPKTCLLACATSVMQYWGSDITYNDFSTKPRLIAGGVTFAEAQSWLTYYGFNSLTCSSSNEQIKELLDNDIPVIISQGNTTKHAIIVESFNEKDGLFRIMDPLKGKVELSDKNLALKHQQAANQTMIVFPDTIDIAKQLEQSNLPIELWKKQNKEYLSIDCYVRAKSESDRTKQLLLLKEATTHYLLNTDALLLYAEKLGEASYLTEASVVLRKLLVIEPNNQQAKSLKKRFGL